MDKQVPKTQDEILSGGSSPEALFGALQHAQAALENCKKEVGERTADVERRSIAATVRQLLPVYDALAAAHGHAEGVPAGFKKGIEAIQSSFEHSLRVFGCVRIETKDKLYDPKFHEVAESVSQPDVLPWSIIEEVASGWMWKDSHEVIRPAKVKIVKQ